MLLAVLVGCGGDATSESDDGAHSAASTPTAETGGDTGVVPIGCTVDDELKVRCTFRRAEPGPLELTLELPAEGRTETFVGDSAALDGELVGWDLPVDSDVFATVWDHGQPSTSTLLHSPLPPSADIAVDVTVDGPSMVDRILLPFSCSDAPQLMAIDSLGRVRWLQDVGGGTQAMPTLATSGRGGAIAVTARDTLREWTWDGTRVLDLSMGAGTLPRLVHHAIDTVGDETFVLDADAEMLGDASYIVDGVTHVQGGVASHVWEVTRIVDPTTLPNVRGPSYWFQYLGSIDAIHENSIDVLPDGSWILSLKHLDTVVKVGTDGQVVWSLLGATEPLAFQDEALTVIGDKVDPTFEFPHDPNVSPWGSLLLLDNGRNGENSRVLEFVVDETARTATAVRSWDLGDSCPVQGSVVGLPDHSVFAVCARTRTLYELDDAGIRRQMTVSCRADGGGLALARAYPTNLRD